jgi:hypothetical protein
MHIWCLEDLTMKNMSIRNEADRKSLEAVGYKWVTVRPRGENKGRIVSKHRTYEAANKRAKGLELAIEEVQEGQWF